MKHVAVYGGSFDPPHLCHLLLTTYAITRGDFDEVRITPVYAHPFHKSLAPFDTRVDMLRRSFAFMGPRVVIDTIEKELPEPNYTIGTVRAMLERDEDIKITWLCGADVYAERHRWKDWSELEGLVDFQVYGREGTSEDCTSQNLPLLPNISSSEIRRKIMRGDNVEHIVPRDALAIIQRHGLYGA